MPMGLFQSQNFEKFFVLENKGEMAISAPSLKGFLAFRKYSLIGKGVRHIFLREACGRLAPYLFQ